MPDAFFSYSRRDGDFVRRLAGALKERGKEVWVDLDGIRDTERFPEALRRAIEASDAFVFVISPDPFACGRPITTCRRECRDSAKRTSIP